MRKMTASEASRNFAALLDAAQGGETIVITRAGRRVALITPAPRANGAALRAVLGRWRGDAALDDRFADKVRAAREAVTSGSDTDPWRA